MAKITSIDQLYCFTKSGTVVGSSTWSETTTTTTASIPSYGSPQSYSSSAQVSTSSVSTEQNRFFIKQDNGKEEEIKLSGGQFPVRDGHRVEIVYFGPAGGNSGWPIAYHNYQTDKTFFYTDNLSAVRGMQFRGGCLGSVLLLAAVGLFFAADSMFRSGVDAVIILGGLGALIGGAIIAILAGSMSARRIKRVDEQIFAKCRALIGQ